MGSNPCSAITNSIKTQASHLFIYRMIYRIISLILDFVHLWRGASNSIHLQQTLSCVAYGHSRPLSLAASHYRDIHFPSLPLTRGHHWLLYGWPFRDKEKSIGGRSVYESMFPLEKKDTGRKSLFPCHYSLLGTLCVRMRSSGQGSYPMTTQRPTPG